MTEKVLSLLGTLIKRVDELVPFNLLPPVAGTVMGRSDESVLAKFLPPLSKRGEFVSEAVIHQGERKHHLVDFSTPLTNRDPIAENGVLYISFREAFTKEALMSVRSLREHCPDLPVAVFTDKPDLVLESDLKEDPNLYLVHIDPKHVRSKVDFIHRSPFENTLYLDSDTVVAHDISDLFDSLRRFDIAVTHDYARKRENYAEQIDEYDVIPYSFSEVNGGVMAYKANNRVEGFFDLWQEKFYKYFNVTQGWDQVSLRIALWQSDVSLYHMPTEYNIVDQESRDKADRNANELGEDHLSPRIYHAHYDREIKEGEYNVDSLEELRDIVAEKTIDY